MQSVIIETVSGCNLSCDYCYASPDFEHEEMSEKTVRDILDNYSQFDEARITWHGGEPLLKDMDFFEQVMEIEKNYDMDFKNVIQTNSTLITPEKAQFMANNDFKVCSSLDGPKELHDENRKFPDGSGSFERVIEGIKNLDNVGLNYALVSVITKNKIGRERELFDFFKDKTDSVEFNPVIKEGGELTNEELFSFYKSMYDLWIEDGGVDPGPIKQITKSLFQESNSLCTYTPDCSQNFLGVGHNGIIYPCGRFIGENDFEIGEIDSDDLSLLYDRKKGILHPEINESCDIFEICGCGCPYDNLKVKGDLNEPAYCDTRKELIEYIRNDLMERGYDEE